jgi:citrate synthase
MSKKPATTAICEFNPTQIFVRGADLCEELIPGISISDYIFLLIAGKRPTPRERKIVDAALVSLAEHGLTPSAVAARLTYMGAPESLQGAVAAGLLGVGDQFVGTVALVAPLLEEIVAGASAEDAAAAIVARYRQAKALVPGMGQPHHKPDDPRSPALFAVAEAAGVDGRYIRALKTLGAAVDAAFGRHYTINAPAAVAALFLEIDIPIAQMRGFILISRCIGLVAHIAEEQTHPIGRTLWESAAQAIEFVAAS